jgi:hypothetical protein
MSKDTLFRSFWLGATFNLSTSKGLPTTITAPADHHLYSTAPNHRPFIAQLNQLTAAAGSEGLIFAKALATSLTSWGDVMAK